MVNSGDRGLSPHVVDSIESSETSETSLSGLRLQLTSLGILRATEAIAWTSIFPYVYFMIQSFDGVPESQITFYAGLLVAIFTFCEFLSGMIWARVSDRIGRKLVLLVGSVCGMIAALLLGVSRNLTLAIASRAFGGLLNPNVGLIQTCVVELAQKKGQQAKALSIVASIRSTGSLIGPVLGGVLANPSVLYPSIFPANSIWTTYPFILPNLVVALLQLVSLIVVFLFLAETHPHLAGQSDIGLRLGTSLLSYLPGHAYKTSARDSYIYARLDDLQRDGQMLGAEDISNDAHHGSEDTRTVPQNEQPPQMDQPKTVFTLQVVLQILSVSLLAFHKVSSDAVMPTFLATPLATSAIGQASASDFFRSRGGFGYSSRTIGLVLLSQAIVGLVAQALLVPRFIDRVGPLRAYRIVLGIYPLMYIFTPLLPNLASWVSLTLVILDAWIRVILSSTGYICSAILTTNTASSRDFLARINGASASASCLSRSLGPILTGKLFAIGLGIGQVAIAFWTLSAIALLGFVESFFLKDQV
ncbi:major facilitator superfamily domain-containing protein [Hypomontagnella monticulosa]|nr:major facilitator superfamily domain-containing protein [Hypomontagnella monticulosa]